MTNKKYMFATWWNWKNKFFGMKLKGVYFAVRILFLPKLAFGCPSASLASSGKGILKKILRLVSSGSPPSEASVSSGIPSNVGVSALSLFFSPELVLL